MKSKAFSKIWVIIGLIVLLAGGITLALKLVWKYPRPPIESEIKVNLDREFKLRVNQTVLIESENIKIKFLDVTEDSRCPSNVECVWEGQVTISVNIQKNEQNLGDFSLTSRSGHEDLAVKTFDGYSIKLVKVDPYPKSGETIELSDYIITLMITYGKEATGLLPLDAQLIEIQPLQSQAYPDRALMLWMLNPVRHPKEDTIYTCPEFTRGSFYSGPTRVSLIDAKEMKIINTVDIVDRKGKDTFDISYRIRKDRWDHYHLIDTEDATEITPKIMWLMDYNGDGKELEFALFDAMGCMGLDTTLIGYSEKKDKVVVYPIETDGAVSYWADYLFSKKPKEKGYWEYEIDYSGRGGCLEKHEVYYNAQKEIFEQRLISICPEL